MGNQVSSSTQSELVPRERPEEVAEAIQRLRALSFEERGRMIVAACQLAADIEAGKRKMGLPPSKRDTMPAATLEFFRQRIANGRR
jgi:hypothetical protein